EATDRRDSHEEKRPGRIAPQGCPARTPFRTPLPCFPRPPGPRKANARVGVACLPPAEAPAVGPPRLEEQRHDLVRLPAGPRPVDDAAAIGRGRRDARRVPPAPPEAPRSGRAARNPRP